MAEDGCLKRYIGEASGHEKVWKIAERSDVVQRSDEMVSRLGRGVARVVQSDQMSSVELIDNMLRLNYTERPQSVFSVQKRLVARPDIMQKERPTLFNLIKDRLSKEL